MSTRADELDDLFDVFTYAEDAECDARIAAFNGTLTEMLAVLTATLDRAHRLPSRGALLDRAQMVAIMTYPNPMQASTCLSGLDGGSLRNCQWCGCKCNAAYYVTERHLHAICYSCREFAWSNTQLKNDVEALLIAILGTLT